MTVYKILWIVDFLGALVVLYFFVVGLGDGTVSASNMALWLTILGVIAAIFWASSWLRNHQHNRLSTGLLLVLAVPTLLYAAYILFALLFNPRWN